MAKLFPFWKLKTPPPTITERIINGGFEDGDAPWVYYGAWRDDAMSHTGLWSCYIPRFDAYYVEQTLSVPVLGSKVTVAQFAMFDVALTGQLTLTLFYDDATQDDIPRVGLLNEWAVKDFKININPAKTLTKIRFTCNTPVSSIAYSVDDVTVQAWTS